MISSTTRGSSVWGLIGSTDVKTSGVVVTEDLKATAEGARIDATNKVKIKSLADVSDFMIGHYWFVF